MENKLEDYCSFEVAKLLKEKGFDEKVSAHYLVHPSGFSEFFDKKDEFPEPEDVWLKCPTHQMAIAWILEKYNVSIEVSALKRNCWVYTIYKIFDNKVKELYNNGEFNSHGKAVEAAIKYYIENLI